MSIIRAPRARPAPVAGAVPACAATRAPEVIVVTLDADLESALRAASPATPILVATTPAALADLLMAGRARALVLDIGALDSAAVTVARHLAEQFPDVPLVAVGSREDEARLAGLISRGLVYRFLHRPVSTARTRTFIDAALRRSGEIGSRVPPSPERASAPTPAPAQHRSLLAFGTAGAVATLGLGLWLALRPPPPSPVAVPLPGVATPASGRVERAAVPVAGAASSTPAAVVPLTTRAPVAPVLALATAPAAQPAPAPAPEPAPARATSHDSADTPVSAAPAATAAAAPEAISRDASNETPAAGARAVRTEPGPAPADPPGADAPVPADPPPPDAG